LENASQAASSLTINPSNFTPSYLAGHADTDNFVAEKIETDPQITGNGSFKEEVVIRNADSGKG
jgi:hypothetical protein